MTPTHTHTLNDSHTYRHTHSLNIKHYIYYVFKLAATHKILSVLPCQSSAEVILHPRAIGMPDPHSDTHTHTHTQWLTYRHTQMYDPQHSHTHNTKTLLTNIGCKHCLFTMYNTQWIPRHHGGLVLGFFELLIFIDVFVDTSIKLFAWRLPLCNSEIQRLLFALSKPSGLDGMPIMSDTFLQNKCICTTDTHTHTHTSIHKSRCPGHLWEHCHDPFYLFLSGSLCLHQSESQL